MSKFLSSAFSGLAPYTPGEQPQNRKYIKLNTNESPFPPAPGVIEAVNADRVSELNLYSDPQASTLIEAIAENFGVQRDMVAVGNGSDELLAFSFMAFCEKGVAFADITYGFYEVYASLFGLDTKVIPLSDKFEVVPSDYSNLARTIFIANPNAPTGLILSLSQIEEILISNRESLVVIDEAYVDFGGESAVPLICKYDNLLVTGTFSKSRSMAGARLGFGVGNRELIRDLNTIKYSTNPYNVNAMTQAAGLGTLHDAAYTKENCRTVCETREYTKNALSSLGFTLTESRTNFLFASHPKFPGDSLYTLLRENGILIRHFKTARICDYNRITVGSREEMEILIKTIMKLLEEK